VISLSPGSGSVFDGTANTAVFGSAVGNPAPAALTTVAAAFPTAVGSGNNAFVIGGKGGAGGSTVDGVGGSGGNGGNVYLIIPGGTNNGGAGAPWSAVAASTGLAQFNAAGTVLLGVSAPGAGPGAALSATAGAGAGGVVPLGIGTVGALSGIAAAAVITIAVGGAGGAGGLVTAGGLGIAGASGRGGGVTLSVPASFASTAIGGAGVPGAAGASAAASP
jgi:hypothetical protein